MKIFKGCAPWILSDQPPNHYHCCVTSPPYWGLRDYGGEPSDWPAVSYAPMAGLQPVEVAAQRCCLGLEATPEAFIGHLVLVFREVRRVLRGDGTLWLNLGDSFSAERWSNKPSTSGVGRACQDVVATKRSGLPDKNLVGIPWRAAMALQADGWYLRSEVVWAKPNPMPESVTDRPTKAHEQVFLLTKQPRYFYDAEAVREPLVKGAAGSRFDRGKTGENGMGRVQDGDREDNPAGRNLRTVWTIATRPSRVSHFAVMVPALAERCIKAGTSEHGCCAACGAPWVRVVEREGCDVGRGKTGHTRARGVGRRGGRADRELPPGYAPVVRTLSWRPSCPCEPSAPVPCRVLDPFGGSGTTAAVAAVLGRVGSLCEPNQAYIDIVPLRFQEIAKIVSRFARPEPTQPKLKRLKELPQRT
jgi:DNA modification methylase